jgi:hypothetical protein
MIFFKSPSEKLTSEQQSVMRAHWEWSGRYAMFWIIVIFLVLDYLDADDSVRTLSLFLLVTITLVNAIWRAAGVLAARIELMLMSRQDHDKPES